MPHKKKHKKKSPTQKKDIKENKKNKEIKEKIKTPKKAASIFPKVGLIIFGLFLLLMTGIFMYFKLTRPQSIAELLPANQTVGFVEVTINPNNSQVSEATELLAKYSIYSIDKMEKMLKEKFQLDFSKDIEPWIGRRISFAVLAKDSSPYINFIPVAFLETRDKTKTIDFLKTLALKQGNDSFKETFYKKTPIYKYTLSHDLHFTFINNYLVFSSGEEGVKLIIDAQHSPTPKISSTKNFYKVRDNLPSNHIAFAYSNFELALKSLNHNPKLLKEKMQQLKAFNPYLKLFKAIGFVLVADKPSLKIQQFALLNTDFLSGDGFIKSEKKYNPILPELVEKNIVFYSGGQDLTQQLQRLMEIFKTNQNTDTAVFEGALRNEIARFFGKNINLEEHIYPLLKGEYALVQGVSEKQPDIKLLLELKDSEKDKSRFEALMKNFQKVSAVFAPQEVEIELPDGTKATELVANQEAISADTKIYKGYEIKSINMGEKPWGVHYVVIDHKGKTIAIIASQLESIKKSINAAKEDHDNLTKSSIYSEEVLKQLSYADEISFANIQYFQLKKIRKYLEPFAETVISKNYFTDGISTIYSFRVR